MLQRAASNAYSWWWASHIRTKQSKWLDSNLQEMEARVKKMLKVIETDADSFARRAELYFKKRPELIAFVEDIYRAYRALAERYDHISGELHKANHTIATACPDQVQYAMLEEEDSLPKAITPINPDKINQPIVEGLMKRKRESHSPMKKEDKQSSAPLISKKETEEEINKLQKEILVLQTEKEYIKSSYESGIAKYWEIEKQVMEKQEKVYYLQGEFSTSVVIEDNEARSLMTTAALRSCEDTIVNLQEQRRKSLEQAKVEAERVKIATEKLKNLKREHLEMENSEVSGENKLMSFTAEKVAEDASSLNKATLEIQSIYEKVKTHFKMNPESSVIEVAEKVNELVNKVITLELIISSQAVQINQLTSDNNELDKSLHNLEGEKAILINDLNALTKRLKEVEEELSRVQAVEKRVQDEEIIFQEKFTEVCQSISDISEKLRPYPLENDSPVDAFAEADASTFKVEPQRISQVEEVTEIHDGKEGFEEEIHTTQEYVDDPLMTGIVSESKSTSENIEDSKEVTEVGEKGSSQTGLERKENIFQADYRSTSQNYGETKRGLPETEKKNEGDLEETVAMITELKNVIAMRDGEIELLRQQLSPQKTSSRGTLDVPSVEDTWDGHQKPESTSNSLIVTGDSELQYSDKREDHASTTKRKSNIEFPELQSFPEEGTHLDSLSKLRSISLIEEKFRRDIDALCDGNLEFWLRFSTSFHQILEFKSKYKGLQGEISKLGNNKAAEINDSAIEDQAEVPESASISKELRELKTEIQVWLEQCELLGAELQSRISSLSELQDEISSAINIKSESAGILFTPYQAATLHGQVMNMKQENIKAANELQVGVDQVRRLQTDIEKQLPKLDHYFKPSPSETSPRSPNSSGTTHIPLRVFLFGAKPKKRSFFERIQPVFQRQKREASSSPLA